MHLARPLHRADGAMLMPEGTELTEAALTQLQQRGIEYVFVALEDGRDEAAVVRDLAAAEERVRFIFRDERADGAQEHPGMGEAREALRDAVMDYRRAGWGA